jgi:hypothetical protein
MLPGKITRFGDYMLQNITVSWSIAPAALSLVPRGNDDGASQKPRGERNSLLLNAQ